MNKQLLAETRREIEDWPGVTLTQENAGKHGRIVLHYKGESRIVIVSNTPSDVRVQKNHIATVRRELRGLGAIKTVARPSPHRRESNKPVRFAVPSVRAPVLTNPFETLEHRPMNADPIAAIFAGINKLRYSEMLDLAQYLSDTACAGEMRRSRPHEWAQMLQIAADNYGRPEGDPVPEQPA